MQRTLSYIAGAAITILAAHFFVTPSGSADGLTNSKADVTFNNDVAPILFKNCVQCHRPGEAAPMSLLSYKEARPWACSIREKVLSREMPPWHADPHVGQFSNAPRLTQAEIDTITAWVDGGAKEGVPRDLIAIPKGARFMAPGYLDNSGRNKNNPDPARAVRFGEPTYDEMMIRWIEYTVDGQSLKPSAAP
jgi:mono/diheme cytochrome c family protein